MRSFAPRAALVPAAVAGGLPALVYALAGVAVVAAPRRLLPASAADAFLRRWLDPGVAVGGDPFVYGVPLAAFLAGYVAARRSDGGPLPLFAAFLAAGALSYGLIGLIAWSLAAPAARPVDPLSVYAVAHLRPVIAFAVAGTAGAALASVRARRDGPAAGSTSGG